MLQEIDGLSIGVPQSNVEAAGKKKKKAASGDALDDLFSFLDDFEEADEGDAGTNAKGDGGTTNRASIATFSSGIGEEAVANLISSELDNIFESELGQLTKDSLGVEGLRREVSATSLKITPLKTPSNQNVNVEPRRGSNAAISVCQVDI